MNRLENKTDHKVHTHVYYVDPAHHVRTATVVATATAGPAPKVTLTDEGTGLTFAYPLAAVFADESGARKYAHYMLNRYTFLRRELSMDPKGFAERYDLLTDRDAGELWLDYMRSHALDAYD